MSPIHPGRKWQSDMRNLSMRPFDGSAGDYSALAVIRNATLRAMTLPEDFVEWDGNRMAEFYNRSGFTLAENAWLIFLGAQPIAAAVLYPRFIFHDRPPGNFDMYVVPEQSRHGLGSRLLAHLEQAALYRGYPTLETTIASEDVHSTAFLARHHFSVVAQSLHLTCYSLNKGELITLPEGYSIRPLADLSAAPDFYMDATNRLGSYDSNYSLIRPEEMERLASGGHWEPEGVLFAFDPTGRVVGVIRASGAGSPRGYLHEIRIEPASRGLGLGMAMVKSALHYLSERGVRTADLDTPGENTAAHTLALRAGFTVTRHWRHFLKRLEATQ